MDEQRYNITYLSMLIGIFPVAVFIASYINVKIIMVANIVDEIKYSINDFPLSNLYYSPSCNETDYSHSLYTFPGSTSGCSCLNVTYYSKAQDHRDEVFPDKCNDNQTTNGCEMLRETGSMELFNWKNG